MRGARILFAVAFMAACGGTGGAPGGAAGVGGAAGTGGALSSTSVGATGSTSTGGGGDLFGSTTAAGTGGAAPCSGGDAGSPGVLAADVQDSLLASDGDRVVAIRQGLLKEDGTCSVLRILPVSCAPSVTWCLGLVPVGGVALQGGDVFWVEGGGVKKAPVLGDGSSAVTLSSGGPTNGLGLALDATDVYWTNPDGGTVRRVPRDGGPTIDVAIGEASPTQVAVDDVNAYWIAAGTKAIRAVPKSLATAPFDVATGLASPKGLTVSAGHVFWLDGDALMSAPAMGGAATPLVTGLAGPTSVAADATHVYFTEWGANPADAQGSVSRVPVGGGSVEVLATGQRSPDALALDEGAVVWESGDGVQRMEK